MPLPFPEVAALACGVGRRLTVAERACPALRAKHLTNFLVSSFSFFDSGCPKAAGDYPKLLAVSKAQALVVENLLEELSEFCELSPADWRPARGLGRLHAAVELLSNWSKPSSSGASMPEGPGLEGKLCGDEGLKLAATSARPVVVGRVKLRSKGLGCDPAVHLRG